MSLGGFFMTFIKLSFKTYPAFDKVIQQRTLVAQNT
jgi:hypothetical protein